MKTFITLFCLGATCAAAELPLNPKFIQAEIQVESGGNDKALGDYVKGVPTARGCLQIHRAAFDDAIRFNPALKLNGNYNFLTNRSYSVSTMTAYLNLYCRAAIKSNDFEILARTWNGGCGWRKNPHATDGYWKKIQKQLDKLK